MAWTKRNPTLLVGIPHTGHVTMEWALAFRQLSIPFPHLYSFVRGVPIDRARNQLVETMLEKGCEWLFFLDSDVIVPPNIIEKLMAHKQPIMSALYYRRYPPYNPSMWKLAEHPKPEGKYTPIMSFPKGEIVEADVIGMGACLIHRRVFEKLEPPWFKWTQGWEKGGVSEDFYFCEKAREKGFRLLVDTSIVCKHVVEGLIYEGQITSFSV